MFSLLNLACDLVIILSLVGIIRSPLTIVWFTRWSFRLYNLERAMTLGIISKGLCRRSYGNGLLLSDFIVSSEVDRVLEPFAQNNL